MKVSDIIHFFKDFYEDFDSQKAFDMMNRLQIGLDKKLKTLSKGTKEKVKLGLKPVIGNGGANNTLFYFNHS